MKHLAKILARTLNQNSQQNFFVFKNKINSTIDNNFYILVILANFMSKIPANVNENKATRTNIRKNLNHDNSLCKTKFEKILLIPHCTLDGLIIDITHNSVR